MLGPLGSWHFGPEALLLESLDPWGELGFRASCVIPKVREANIGNVSQMVEPSTLNPEPQTCVRSPGFGICAFNVAEALYEGLGLLNQPQNHTKIHIFGCYSDYTLDTITNTITITITVTSQKLQIILEGPID